jgi:hypothetical protein
MEPGLPDFSWCMKPNIPNWVNFGGPWKGKRWPFGIFYGHLVAIWYFSPVLV